MDESFTNETLLQIPQNPPFIKAKYRKPIFFTILILFLIVAGSIILASICKNKKSIRFKNYLNRSSRYYCHLTRYPDLCFDSINSILKTSLIKSNPSPIFSASIRVAINELNKTQSQNPSCEKMVNRSLNRLNESLSVLSVDWNVESLTYLEMDEIRARVLSAAGDASECLSALEEIGAPGVEELKIGVERARKYMINSAGLINGREFILFDFYRPYIENDGEDYYEYEYGSYSYYIFDYRFLVCMYSAMYLFLALLYFLFWRGH